MSAEKRYYLIGNNNSLKKTVGAFNLTPTRVVAAFTKPPDTIHDKIEPCTDHFTYHRSGAVDHTFEKNKKPISKGTFKQLSPIESLNDPEFIMKGRFHYFDFQEINLKHYDDKISKAGVIELSTDGTNYHK